MARSGLFHGSPTQGKKDAPGRSAVRGEEQVLAGVLLRELDVKVEGEVGVGRHGGILVRRRGRGETQDEEGGNGEFGFH